MTDKTPIRWTMQTDRFRNGIMYQERSKMIEYSSGMWVLYADYEALQSHITRLEAALLAIIKHQEIALGSLSNLSVTKSMAQAALKGSK